MIVGYVAIKEKLNNSPIFNMSLSSKELFHSNFWAWLFEIEPQSRKLFFGNIEQIEKAKVYREKDNIDVMLEFPNKEKYIIENKLKSLPRLDQLVEYTKKLQPNFRQGILTGIICPNFVLPTGWIFLSYKDIAQKLKELDLKNQYYKSIIEDYISVIENISDILISGNNNMANKYSPNLVPQEIIDLRLADIFKKLCMDNFVNFLQKNCKDEHIIIKQDFTNSTALLNVELSAKDTIGIQIQGLQYRFFVVRDTEISKDELFNEYKNKGWFYNYDKHNKQLLIEDKKESSSMRTEYCSYLTKEYCFVYQYFNLLENISYLELANKISTDIQRAKQLFQ